MRNMFVLILRSEGKRLLRSRILTRVTEVTVKLPIRQALSVSEETNGVSARGEIGLKLGASRRMGIQVLSGGM
jgi:hypothetical protein